MHDVVLKGCRPEPLASYLKALGVLRLVAEQKDKNAQGFWQGEHFVLRSVLDEEALMRFFREEWSPTPVVSPWNGGSGFYPKDNREAVDTIMQSTSPRLAAYQAAIRTARQMIAERGWTERPADEDKAWMLGALRARLDDAAIAWLDAAVVLGEERPLFPPLLGTGGNDGRLDFSNNCMQRVVAALDDDGRLVAASLLGTSEVVRFQGAMGLYAPAADVRTNPWDFIFLIEGALLFAGAATKRLASAAPGTLAFPFHARAAGGNATLAPSDGGKSRDELWLPIWTNAASLRETQALFAEGRAKVGTYVRGADGLHLDERDAQTSLDFARAIARLGTDRGIAGFARYGFHERNGLAYFATPLGRFDVGEVGYARLLDELDAWFARLRRAATGDRAPASVTRAFGTLEDAFFGVAAGAHPSVALLGLADVEQALGRSLGFAEGAFLPPVPELREEWWEAVEDSIEARLGICLGRLPQVRSRLLPTDPRFSRRWGRAEDNGFVFRQRPLVENLHALLLRDDIEAQQGLARAFDATNPCRLEDIVAFIDGEVDDELVERWARAATLLPPGGASADQASTHDDVILPPATFSVLALVLRGVLVDGTAVKRTQTMLARACAGDSASATAAALQRLNAVGRALPVRALHESVQRTRRVAAALAFPLSPEQRWRLESAVLPKATSQSDEVST